MYNFKSKASLLIAMILSLAVLSSAYAGEILVWESGDSVRNITIGDRTYGRSYAPTEDSTENNVTVDGATSTNLATVIGGYSTADADIFSNTVNISNSTISSRALGGVSYTGDAYNNTIIADNVTFSYRLHGGRSTDGNVYGNRVQLTDSTVNSYFFGGLSINGGVSSNTVTISGGTYNRVHGGFSENGSSTGNTLNLTGATFNNQAIGGWANGEGSANSNIVNFNSGSISGAMYGGYSVSGDASYNTLNITGGTALNSLFGGYSQGNGTTNGNYVNVSDGTVYRIYGGYSNFGLAENNHVVITGGTVTDRVYAGYSASGSVFNNVSNMSGGTVNTYLQGGRSESGLVQNNSVYLSDNASVLLSILGGRTISGQAVENGAYVSGGSVGGGVYGGYSVSGGASGNYAIITGGTIDDSVYGGYSEETGEVYGNYATVSAGTVNTNVYGGASEHGLADYNTVQISENADIDGSVYGGWASDNVTDVGRAIYNTATISGGDIAGSVYGGYASAGEVDYNSVVVSGGTITGSVYGGYASDNSSVGENVRYNSVAISGGNIQDSVHGGYSSVGNAEYNSVDLTDGTVASDIYGGYAASGSSLNNIVSVSGGNISGTIYGGYSSGSSADNNTVYMTDGTVSTDIIGGQGQTAYGNDVTISGGSFTGTVYAGSSSGLASSNVVTITGDAVFSNANIYGGYSTQSSGNILNLNNYTGSSAISTLDYFQEYNFDVAAGVRAGGTYVTVTNLNLNADTYVNKITFREKALLDKGETLYLIAATNVSGQITNNGQEYIEDNGALFHYYYTLVQDDTGIYLTSDGVVFDSKNKVLLEGRLASIAFVNQSTDMIIDLGIRAAKKALVEQNSKVALFMVTSGGKSRYDTGSHIDMYGNTNAIGVTTRAATASNSIMGGVYMEIGYADFNSYNSFADSPTVKGRGHNYYWGGGIMGRYDHISGFYVDASARMGKNRTKFNADLSYDDLTAGSYSLDTPYYGAHGGLGYILGITESLEVDISTRYIWTRLESDSIMAFGDRVHFDTTDSNRWRSNVRLRKYFQAVSIFAGGGYEYEYGGKAKATTYGYSFTDVPNIKGGTGIGELGFSIASGIFYADVDFSGYTGVRTGIMASLRMGAVF